MALTPEAIKNLDSASARIAAGKGSAADVKNVEYAKTRRGYVYKPTSTVQPPDAGKGEQYYGIEQGSPTFPDGTKNPMYLKNSTTPVPPPPSTPAPNPGLQVALAREAQGRASAADKKNLAYARSKGTIPPLVPADVPAPPAEQPATKPSASNRTANLDIASQRIAEGRGSAQDKKNVAYAKQNLGYNPQQEIAQINEDANANQDTELAVIEDEAGRTVDLTTSEGLLGRLNNILQDEDTRQAETPSMSKVLADERARLGVGDLETSLNNLDADLKQLDATYSSTQEQEETRQVGLGAVRRRQGAIDVEYNRQRRDMVAERDSVANQLNQKYAVINTMISATNMDIDNARQDYQTKFNSAIQMINLARGIEQDQKTDQQRKMDNARANAQVMYNIIKEGNVSYDGLSEAQKLDIKNMEISAGLPVGFVGFISQTVDEPVVHFGSEFTDASGNRIMPIITIDKATGNMVTRSVNVGRAKPEGGGSYQPPSSYQEWVLAGKESGTGKTYAQYLADKNAGDPTEAETNRSAQADMSEILNTKKGNDGYVSPSSYKTARSSWIGKGYDAEDFYTNFRIYVNPSHYSDYGITAVQWNS